MEKDGVFLDCEFLKKLSVELEIKLNLSISEIYEMAGREFNINSTKQLAEILFDELELKPIRKRSTDVRVMEILKNYHPLPEKILEYRQYKKLKSTYVDALPEFVNKNTLFSEEAEVWKITSCMRCRGLNRNFFGPHS